MPRRQRRWDSLLFSIRWANRTSWRQGLAPRRTDGVALAAIVVAHLLMWLGVSSLWNPSVSSDGGVELRVAAIQGNIPQIEKWDEAALGATLSRYEELTRSAALAGNAPLYQMRDRLEGAQL